MELYEVPAFPPHLVGQPVTTAARYLLDVHHALLLALGPPGRGQGGVDGSTSGGCLLPAVGQVVHCCAGSAGQPQSSMQGSRAPPSRPSAAVHISTCCLVVCAPRQTLGTLQCLHLLTHWRVCMALLPCSASCRSAAATSSPWTCGWRWPSGVRPRSCLISGRSGGTPRTSPRQRWCWATSIRSRSRRNNTCSPRQGGLLLRRVAA